MLKIALFLIAKLETSKMSLNWGMDKQTVVQTYNRLLLVNKNEQWIYAKNWMILQ